MSMSRVPRHCETILHQRIVDHSINIYSKQKILYVQKKKIIHVDCLLSFLMENPCNPSEIISGWKFCFAFAHHLVTLPYKWEKKKINNMLNNANIKLNVGFRIVWVKCERSIPISFYFFNIHTWILFDLRSRKCMLWRIRGGRKIVSFFSLLEHQEDFMTTLCRNKSESIANLCTKSMAAVFWVKITAFKDFGSRGNACTFFGLFQERRRGEKELCYIPFSKRSKNWTWFV